MNDEDEINGSLDSPLPKLTREPFEREEEFNRKFAVHIAIESAKLYALFDHYGLRNGDFASLALALAREYVPAFNPESGRRGRPRKWTPWILAILRVETHRKISELGLADNEIGTAAAALAKEPRWASFVSRSEGLNIDHDPAEALRKKYYAAENADAQFDAVEASFRRSYQGADVSVVDLAERDFREYEANGQIQYWDAMVDEALNGSYS